MKDSASIKGTQSVSRVSGTVLKGAKRGRALGYPTANIPLLGSTLSGVYAAKVTVRAGEAPHVAAVFADPARGVLEAHLLDFSDDLYGMEITVELHKKLREAADFESDAELRNAIAQDIASVREYFDL